MPLPKIRKTAPEQSNPNNGLAEASDPQRSRDGTGGMGLLGKFLFDRTPAKQPTDAIPIAKIAPRDLIEARTSKQSHLYRLGHSTVLMKFGADYWLADPVFSARVSPSRFIGPKRFHAPPLDITDLPPLKGVVISHNHYDHLDRATIRALIGKVERYIVPIGVAKYLIGWGVAPKDITELGWWQSVEAGTLRITATPTQHFSGRGLRDGNKSLWASFVFQFADQQVFFGSDSGYFDGFAKIGARFGRFDVTLLESGAYDTAWPTVHMTPEETIQAHLDLGGGVLMPIHNGTFRLAFHPWKEPLERLVILAAERDVTLLTPNIGARVVLGAPVECNAWWGDIR